MPKSLFSSSSLSSGIWNQATQSEQLIKHPLHSGWKLIDNKFVIDWYDGQQLPSCLKDILNSNDITLESDDEENNDFGMDESD